MAPTITQGRIKERTRNTKGSKVNTIFKAVVPISYSDSVKQERDVVDANVLNKSDLTPLHLASYYGWAEMVRVLLDSGATANSEDNLCRTPLHLVAKGASSDLGHDGVGIAQLLLEHGANSNARDKQQTTPLHFVSYFGNVKMTQVLLERGADASAKNATGYTPLHMVSQGTAYSGSVGIARLLLEYGADKDELGPNGETPLDFASRNKNLKKRASFLDHQCHANYGCFNVKMDQDPTPQEFGLGRVDFHGKPAPST